MWVRLIMPGIQSAVACAVVKGIPSVRTETVVPKIANHVPHLLIRFDPEVTGVTTDQIVEALRSGKPSIELSPDTGEKPHRSIPAEANTLVDRVCMLQPGEGGRWPTNSCGSHQKSVIPVWSQPTPPAPK